ncbi:MAG: oligosaccharide flippase family protein [Prevotella sp.]|jgi:O-antigen/teichoic acid export membrane protein
MKNRHDNNNNNYSHILKYTGIFGGVQGLSVLVGIVRNKLVAMILGPNGMGLMSLFTSTIKLISDSSNFGIGMSAVKDISSHYDAQNSTQMRHSILVIRSWSLLTALLGMLLCAVLGPLLNKWTFTWGDHTLHYILLSPVVGLMAITGGEMAILKGTRKLKSLAEISVMNVVGALITSVPIYYFFGQAGIIPSLVVIALLQMLFTVHYSYRLYPPRYSFSRRLLGDGLGMIKLGFAFVLAGIFGSGAEFLIRSYLNTSSSLDMVGLYNAGYMMTMTYAGLVFSAMETDYFPRLSSIKGTGPQLNKAVNEQMEVSLLIVAPLLVAFIIAQPILLPLLYSGRFMPAMKMIQIMILAMYLRAVKLPVAYIPLAKGDSKSYLLMEALYDVALLVLVVVCFDSWGLTGTGIAIVMAAIFDFFMLFVYMGWRYQFRLSGNILRYMLLQIPVGCLAFALTFQTEGWLYWLGGGLLFLLSLGITVQILKTKTRIVEYLKEKILKR